ncbi:MAG: TIGR04053 family radical SAM/SPASM domain-containing protein [Vicinamibacterales bacterium]
MERQHSFPTDFDTTPFLVIWETTRACALACVHCRADSIPHRDPNELTTDEAFGLIDQVRALGTPPPLFVLTGGDPMRRPDLAQLVRHASDAGLTVALTPSGTAAATPKRIAELKDAGLSRIAVSLDGPDAESHDAFRRVRGSYAWTMRIIETAIALDLPLQINTTVSRLTLPRLHAMAARMAELPITLWAIFFLVQTGRGASLDQVSADECEEVLEFLYDLSLTAPFGIKTTEAPHYQRVVQQRERAREAEGLPTLAVARRRQLRATRSVGDGNGFVFVDHVGNICPSGFLPMSRGNVRTGALADVYRHDELFRTLRNADALEGRCGVCEFRQICGGSRARAYAATGRPLASDPLCSYMGSDVDTPNLPANRTIPLTLVS